MKIVKGRGKNRKVYEVPTGAIVAKADPAEARLFVANVCELIGIAQ